MPPWRNARTPTGKIDDVSIEEDHTWEVESITTQRQRGKEVQFLVRWKGFDHKHSTWEPKKNLAGAAETVKAFEVAYAKQMEESKKEAQEKHKVAVAAQKKKHEETQARVKQALQLIKSKVGSAPRRANASPWWRFWARMSDNKSSDDYHNVVCIVPDPDCEGEYDGKVVSIKRATNTMEDYIKTKYPTLWKGVDKEIRPEKYVDPVDLAQIKVA